MTSFNEIMLRRGKKVIVSTTRKKRLTSVEFVATLNQNIAALGYTLSDNVIKKLAYLNAEELISFYNELVSILKELAGVKSYRPMYPNFPNQVMEASDAELYINALAHYFSFWVVDITGDKEAIWLPQYKKETREELTEKVQLKVIELGRMAEFDAICANLINSKTSVSFTDKEDIRFYLTQVDVSPLIPLNIPHKEVLAFVANILLSKENLFGAVKPQIKTATDVLRLATAMSDGDISLAENTKYRNFKRSERRLLISLLNNCSNICEDMNRHKMKWLRLGEKLHPGEYTTKYHLATDAFKKLRDGTTIETFNSITERLVIADPYSAAQHLKARPGEFARRLDKLMRDTLSGKIITDEFAECAGKVSTPVLLQTLSHFANRNGDSRVVFPKGNTAKVKLVAKAEGYLDKKNAVKVAEICNNALVNRFSGKEAWGSVYIDESLKDIIVPFSQRSASKSTRPLLRGSKLPLGEEKNTVRFFIWWKEAEKRTDLDLSAVFFDDEWVNKGSVYYGNLRYGNINTKYKACHSGDITSAPNGACEFIDIDIPSCLKYGGRYVVMNVNVFSGDRFDKLPECHAGWMLRQDVQSGEVFDARTVQDKFSLTCSGSFAMPLIIDLLERKMIWADASVNNRGGRYQNVITGQHAISVIGKAMTNLKKPNLYNLLQLHAAGRAKKVVTDKAKADVVFDLDYAFQTDKIMEELL